MSNLLNHSLYFYLIIGLIISAICICVLIIYRYCWSSRNGKRFGDNDCIRDYLDAYLIRVKPGFAVLIKGPWGCGKTYFIKHYNCKVRNISQCYVSLFGISNKEEFEFRLWKGLIFDSPYVVFKKYISIIIISIICIVIMWIFGNKPFHYLIDKYPYQWDLCSTFLKAICSSSLFTSILGALSVFSAIALFIWKFLRFKAMEVLLRHFYLVFDDFERVEASCDEVLAWVNEFVEHINCPVILIGNEKEIEERLNYENIQETKNETDNIEKQSAKKEFKGVKDSFAFCHYKMIKEKCIGKEFSFKDNDRIICQALLGQLSHNSLLSKILSSNLDWFVSKILEPLHNQGINTNYRTLQYVMQEFGVYFDSIDSVLNPQIWRILIPQFFSLLYFKKIHKLNDTLVFNQKVTYYLSNFYCFDGKLLQEFREMYPCWMRQWINRPLFPESIWVRIINGETIQKNILDCFINEYLQPAFTLSQRWNMHRNMEDEEFKELLKESITAYKKHTVHSPEDISNIALSIYCSSKSLFWFSKYNNLVKRMFMRYISLEKFKQEFEYNFNTSDKYNQIIAHIKYIECSGSDFGEIKNYLLNVIIEVYNNPSKLFLLLIGKIKNKDIDELEKWYYSENRNNRDMFSHQNFQTLWSTVNELPTKDFAKIHEMFRDHIEVIKGKVMLKDEIDFWEEYLKIAKDDISEWEKANKYIMKCANMEIFIAEVEESLTHYRQMIFSSGGDPSLANE